MNDLRAQLTPSWSGVNIAIMILLFLVAAPLGFVMLAYIIWGRQLGLDLSQPQTFAAAGARLGRAFGAAKQSWSGSTPLSTGEPNTTGDHWQGDTGKPARADTQDEQARLRTQKELDDERAALTRERLAFEEEKRAFKARNQVNS